MSDEITEGLINKLEHLSTDGRLPLEKRLVETAVWYYRNKDRIPAHNLEKRLEFMEKTFSIFLEMIAMTVDRMQRNEGRKTSASLWLPSGIQDTKTGEIYR